MRSIKVSLFKCLEAYENITVGLDEIRRLIVYDESVAQKTTLYRNIAYRVSRNKANEEIKRRSMPAFSVGVLYNNVGRQTAHIVSATGLALCDIDNIRQLSTEKGQPTIEEIKQKISKDPHTVMCYETVSGDGLRVIFRFIRTGDLHLNCEAYPAAWKKGNEYFKEVTGCEYDKACSNFNRLSGLAHDPNAFFNFNAEPFTITDDEMVSENMAILQEPGRPRKVYEAGTQQSKPEEAWPRIQRSLSQRGLNYTPSHRHDYMVHAAYLFNRFGCSKDDLQEWASREWGDMPQQERKDVISHCYRDTDEHGIWRIQQPSRGKRNALMSTTEIRAWMDERMQVIYNMVSDQRMFLLKVEGGKSKEEGVGWRVVDEREEESMRCQMEADTGKRVLTKDVQSVLKSDFAKLVHPIRDYIDSLHAWDGQDHVAKIAAHLKAEPVEPGQSQEEAQATISWALHKWLVAMVATWMNDSVANHEIFTLIGPQGIYKTTFFRYLLPPSLNGYFWENAHNSFHHKDDKLALSENCLVEIEEIDAIEGRDMSELKGLVTSLYIKERRPYARYRTAKARLASFCASGNDQRFLTDQTGTRRWLCFRVSQIDDPRQWQIDYSQLYAQLRQEYLSGFKYWFDEQEEILVDRLNQHFRVVSIEEQLISCRLRKPRGHETPKQMSSSMIAVYLTGGHLSSTLSIRKIGNIMHRLGYRVRHRSDGDYFYVVEIPQNETQTFLTMEEYVERQETGEKETADNEQLALPF